MTKYLLLPLLALLLPSPALQAQYNNIPPAHHVPNLSPGYCAYASLETLGRWRGYPQLHGLTASQVKHSPRYGGTTTVHLKQILDNRGVPSSYQPYGTRDYGTVKKGGAVVTLLSNRPGSMAHAVVVLGLDNQTVYLYDPNFPGRTTIMPRATFARRWAGNAVVVHPITATRGGR
jgi:hypothetical protein